MTSSISRDSAMHELAGPVAVACHDAGAANIILAAMVAEPSARYLPVMQGPAAVLWEKAGRPGSALLSLADAIGRAGSLVSGTGWASTLEHDARRLARRLGRPSVAVIDHWVNYAARFERQGRTELPDVIWVTDPYARTLACRTFPTVPVQQVHNAYLEQQVRDIASAASACDGRILYLLEPVRFTWPGALQSGEFEALDYFMAHLGRLNVGHSPVIRLRPHPSDPAGKYDTWIARQAVASGLDVALDESPTLAEAIGRAEWVAGCETMGLVVALAAGRKAVSTLPPDAPDCRLPQHELMHLRRLGG